MFDPDIRTYITYFFLQALRQIYYNHGSTFGHQLDPINQNIRKVLQNRGWTKDQFDKYEINVKMLQSISKELEEEELIEYFIKAEKKGFLGGKQKKYFYKITIKGLNYIKQLPPPQDPLSKILNDKSNIR